MTNKAHQCSNQSDAPRFPGTGMRRIDWVRIVVSPAGTSCQAVGVADRLPVDRPITLRTATSLVAGGVPVVVRSEAATGHPAMVQV